VLCRYMGKGETLRGRDKGSGRCHCRAIADSCAERVEIMARINICEDEEAGGRHTEMMREGTVCLCAVCVCALCVHCLCFVCCVCVCPCVCSCVLYALFVFVCCVCECVCACALFVCVWCVRVSAVCVSACARVRCLCVYGVFVCLLCVCYLVGETVRSVKVKPLLHRSELAW
jgi:hypothetical protein